jgi:hypothetical protein
MHAGNATGYGHNTIRTYELESRLKLDSNLRGVESRLNYGICFHFSSIKIKK